MYNINVSESTWRRSHVGSIYTPILNRFWGTVILAVDSQCSQHIYDSSLLGKNYRPAKLVVGDTVICPGVSLLYLKFPGDDVPAFVMRLFNRLGVRFIHCSSLFGCTAFLNVISTFGLFFFHWGGNKWMYTGCLHSFTPKGRLYYLIYYLLLCSHWTLT